MTSIRALVVRAAGINCDLETEFALESAGAETRRLHVNRIIEDKGLLDGFQILIFPGGFSYGDDVAAGKILANQIIHHLAEPVKKFIDDGKIVLGICNGFQVLVKTGILPGNGSIAGHGDVTITYNDSGKFEDRWVYLAPKTDKCVFIDPNRQIYLPIAHGEGKVVTKNAQTLDDLKSTKRIAFKYVDKDGSEGPYPINPNGSIGSIAGLTDTTGRVLGLMPHPERHIHRTHHPHWTRLRQRAASNSTVPGTPYGGRLAAEPSTADGMTIFNNAVKYVSENL